MASLLRSLRRSPVLMNCLRTQGPCHQSVCFIQTSKKKKDVGTADGILEKLQESTPNTFEKPKNAMSYGYDILSEKEDSFHYHMTLFCSITLFFVGGAFVLIYMPDFRMINWCSREAHLELHRREKEGLPLVDMNYIPVDQIVLPSDEEIGDMKIIV